MDPARQSPWIARDELQQLFRLIRRTIRAWRRGLATFLVVLVIALVASFLWPRQYKSEAVIHYREGIQWTQSEAAGGGGGGGRRVGQTMKDMLLARAQLAKVIQEMGLYPRLVRSGHVAEAVEEMRLATGFKFDQSDVFVISYAGSSPEEAQRVTTRLTEILRDESARTRSEQARVTVAFIESEQKRTEAELNAKEAVLLRFLARHPEFAQEQVLMGAHGRAARQPDASQSGPDPDGAALAALRREEDRLRRQISSPGPSAVRAPQDPSFITARNDAEAALRAAERTLADRRSNYTEQHPDVQAAIASLKLAQETYRRATEAATAREPALMRQRLEQVQQDIAAFRRLSPRGRTGPRVAGVTAEAAQQIVQLESEWTRLSREVAEARERAQQLDARHFTASIQANMATGGQVPQINVIDPASLPARPLGPSRSRVAILCLLVALTFGLGVALLSAASDDKVYDRTDLERSGLGPVLAEVPESPAPTSDDADGRRRSWRLFSRASPVGESTPGAQPRVSSQAAAIALGQTAASAAAKTDPSTQLVRVHRVKMADGMDSRIPMLSATESPAAAGFRILRHRIAARRDVKTILVTSAAPDEGKTFCALNLALALGEGGRTRVLLLEANFRSPSLARLMGFTPPVDIAEQLTAHRTRGDRPWAVTETPAPWLHLGAVTPGSSARPVLDATLALFFGEFRMSGYDYVVIDGPPVLGSAEANLMEESIDGILFTARAKRSRAGAIGRAIDQVGGTKLLGVVLLQG